VLSSRFTLALLCGVLPAMSADRIPASGGDIEITPITHASVQLVYAGKVIQVDPWRNGNYAHALPADLILVTGAENDHLDIEAIAKIRKPGAPIVISEGSKEKEPEGIVLANGATKDFDGIRVESVAAYDLIPGDPFHPKGRGNGYVVTLGGKRIYLSGVTECTDEVKALHNIDVAFVAMNLPHGRMTMSAAAACMETYKPGIVYPYHYRDAKLQEFKAALAGKPIDVRLAAWYPDPAK
jgi:L-ascorbate metabolism protein UlaG (beta-lactamase superfamily)